MGIAEIDVSDFTFLLHEGESHDPAWLALVEGLGWIGELALRLGPAALVGLVVGYAGYRLTLGFARRMIEHR
ncbi:hypothetical protein LNKW23_26020 [Paralimibaculum aggregatum]|uniref:Uncharacterized protein n=1 Tax=Paralimibaculum aggregatum TaxID=3036245 RepID=A0ABQ6LJG3_9RHOB|nr:hypothetical protein [Limibaculum sp. NKW23]GMG83389.1 hypothetical protein LNKW23_26020 [Limibaculum sp. NKW23]